MYEKKISVIIPVYNRQNLLDQCVHSVLNQSEVETEIILVDDGSTDSSSELCDSYAKSYPNIEVIHEENGGIGTARNAALDIASGDYVFFLDSDDYITPNSLSILLNELEKHDADYVIGNFERVSEDGQFISESYMPKEICNQVIDEDKLWRAAQNPNSYFLFIVVWGKLFKKEIWNSLRFPSIRISEDEFVLPKILENSKRIFVSDFVSYKQTLSTSSLIRSNYNINKLNSPESKLYISDYLLSKGFYDFSIMKFENAISDVCYASLMLHDKCSKRKLNRIYALSRKLFRKIYPHIARKKAMKLFMFSFFPGFYIPLTRIKSKLFK